MPPGAQNRDPSFYGQRNGQDPNRLPQIEWRPLPEYIAPAQIDPELQQALERGADEIRRRIDHQIIYGSRVGRSIANSVSDLETSGWYDIQVPEYTPPPSYFDLYGWEVNGYQGNVSGSVRVGANAIIDTTKHDITQNELDAVVTEAVRNLVRSKQKQPASALNPGARKRPALALSLTTEE